MRSEAVRHIYTIQVPESNLNNRRIAAAVKTGLIDDATIGVLEHYGLRINVNRILPKSTLRAIQAGDLSKGVGYDPDYKVQGNYLVSLKNRARLAGLRIQLAQIDRKLDSGESYQGETLTVSKTLRMMREANRLRAKISIYSALAGEV